MEIKNVIKTIDQLSDLNDSPAVDAIFEILMSSNNKLVKKIALPAIKRMDANMVLESMEHRLEDPKEETRHQAIEVIGWFGSNNREAVRLLTIAREEDQSRKNRGFANSYLIQGP